MLQRCLNTIGCQLRLSQAASVLIALTAATASSLNSNRDNILRHYEEQIKQDSARIQQIYDNTKRLPIQQRRAALGRILKELGSHDHSYWINTADGDTILPDKGNNQIEQQTLTTIHKAYTQPRPRSDWTTDTSQLKQSLDERAKINSREYAVFNSRQLSYFASLWVTQDITEHIRFQQDLLNSSIITLLGCISLSILTSSMLTRRIIQPLKQLSSAAATINTRTPITI